MDLLIHRTQSLPGHFGFITGTIDDGGWDHPSVSSVYYGIHQVHVGPVNKLRICWIFQDLVLLLQGSCQNGMS